MLQFPQVDGKTVNGDSRSLPHDFAGAVNVVLLAFTEIQQYDVDSWMPFLNTLKASHPGLEVYELPTLRRYSFFQRWMIDYWMYHGIPDADVRNRTITLYIDVPPFLKALNLPDESQIYTLIMNDQGQIFATLKGAYSPENAALLAEHLQQVMTPA